MRRTVYNEDLGRYCLVCGCGEYRLCRIKKYEHMSEIAMASNRNSFREVRDVQMFDTIDPFLISFWYSFHNQQDHHMHWFVVLKSA